MATVTVSVGTLQHGFTADDITGSGPWEVEEFGGGFPLLGISVGQAFVDFAGNVYAITDLVDARTFEATDSYGMGVAPVLGDGTVGRMFSGLGTAEASISLFAGAGDTYIIACYNDGLITEAPVTFNDSALGSGGTLKVTVADGEWHRGTPGAGVRLQPSAEGTFMRFAVTSASCPTQIIERLDIVGITVTATATIALLINEDGTNTTTIRNCIARDFVTSGGSNKPIRGFFVNTGATNGVRLENCLAYNFTRAGGSTGEARGFRTDTTNAAFFNCTGYNCVNNFSESGSGTDNVAKNCAGLGHAGGADFSGTWHASSTHNASSDTSAPGSSALKSLTTSDQFVDVTSGSEDLHLKVGADLIGAGVDLSSDFINDLDGHARIVPWDIGADGVPLVTQMATASRFVAGGVHRRVR